MKARGLDRPTSFCDDRDWADFVARVARVAVDPLRCLVGSHPRIEREIGLGRVPRRHALCEVWPRQRPKDGFGGLARACSEHAAKKHPPKGEKWRITAVYFAGGT